MAPTRRRLGRDVGRRRALSAHRAAPAGAAAARRPRPPVPPPPALEAGAERDLERLAESRFRWCAESAADRPAWPRRPVRDPLSRTRLGAVRGAAALRPPRSWS